MKHHIMFFLISSIASIATAEGQSLDHFQALTSSIGIRTRTLFSTVHDPCFNESNWFYENEIIPDPFEIIGSSNFHDVCSSPTAINGGVSSSCDLKNTMKDIAPICTTHNGQPIFIDVKSHCTTDFGEFTSVLHNVPLCMGQRCDKPTIVDILNHMPIEDIGCQYIFAVSDITRICERPGSTFLGFDNVMRRCQWLRKDRARIDKFCHGPITMMHPDYADYTPGLNYTDTTHNTTSDHEQYHIPGLGGNHEAGGAYESCPFTCSRYNKFVKKVWRREGYKVASIKGCRWLARKSRSYKKRMCKKRVYFENVGPASVMCPHICGRRDCHV